MKNKDNVLEDFTKMIATSWTFAKMDETEQKRLFNLLESKRVLGVLKGKYNQRWEILNSIYYGYLIALDYNYNWRETK